jgi:hypothetical protein
LNGGVASGFWGTFGLLGIMGANRKQLNVRGLPYVIPDNMPPKSAKRVMSRPTLTGRKTNAEEAGPARGAAGRPRRGGGASADFRVRVGGGIICFESGSHDYRGGRDGGSYSGGSSGGGGR